MDRLSLILFLLAGVSASAASADRFRTWEVYNGGPEAMKYSSLDQINRTNVHRLETAWTYRSGDAATNSDTLTSLQSNPVIIRGAMYVLGQNHKVIALDAATGRELWVHRSALRGAPTRRGLVYWESPDRRDARVLFTVGSSLCAINATNGEPIKSFGQDGAVTLYIDRDSTRTAGSPSPGIIFEDLIIMGSVVGEMYGGAPGHIRAYDVRTGKLRWVFHTVPHPGEFGYDTWPADSWKRNGGANVWGAFSLDTQRGLVFAPTGSPSYDFYGANRKGQNLFGNCVIALEARTGKRRWHYQVVHHDLWDYDLSAQPLLATITREGQRVDAVIQVSKHGFVFVLDRDTGKPLFPVEERPVPKSDVPGEESWPTQPFPLKPAPVARQHIKIEDLTEFPDASERESIRKTFLAARHEGLFTPPSTNSSIASPGHNGGPLWGGGAFDPATGWFYVSTHDQPSYVKLTRSSAPGGTGESENELRFTTPWTFFRDSAQLPAIKPPWGRMVAIDVNTGDTLWEKLIGDETSLNARGIPATGHKYLKGGPVVTAGGLVFMAGTLDRRIRAFDKRTGDLVWIGELPYSSVAIPAIYEVGGKQFIAIAALAQGDAVVAFALPDAKGGK